MKSLVVLGIGAPTSLNAEIAAGQVPRQDYFGIAARLDADVCTYSKAASEHGAWFTRLFGRRPPIGSAVAAFWARNQYARMFVTGEDIGLPLALMLRASGWRGELTMIVHKCTTDRRKKLFRLLGGKAFAHLICVSEAQRQVLIDEVGFSPDVASSILDSVDEQFFDARQVEPLDKPDQDYVFSCGLENRNYDLLCEAAAQLPVTFRIAASGYMSMSGRQEAGRPPVPPNVTLEKRLSFPDLRRVYAGARFVVVPINDVPYAAGVTGLLEGMAMGKAVVVTRSAGIAEYLTDETGVLVVPSNDPRALADAILTLWNDPARCAAMGAHNRSRLEASMTFDHYCERVARTMKGGAT